jgi:hypothetical protein
MKARVSSSSFKTLTNFNSIINNTSAQEREREEKTRKTSATVFLIELPKILCETVKFDYLTYIFGHDGGDRTLSAKTAIKTFFSLSRTKF